jgi:hypothetical protein
MLAAAGLPVEHEAELLADIIGGFRREYKTQTGELLRKESSLIILQPNAGSLTLWEIKHHYDPSYIRDVAADIASGAARLLDESRTGDLNFNWRDYSAYVPTPANNMSYHPYSRLRTTKASYNKELSRQASCLVNEENRRVLLRLARSGKLSAAKMEECSSVVQSLADSGLIVTCTASGGSRQAYQVSETGRSLLNGSHWMTVWLTSLLIDAGVSAELITWGASSGGDEIDIIAKIEGQSVFFELKDREFGLGDAFPFSSRLARYGGHVGVVITMATVSQEVRRLWLDDRPSRTIVTMEGESQIQSLLKPLVDLVAWESVLVGIEAISASSIGKAIIYNWMKGHSSTIAHFDTIPLTRQSLPNHLRRPVGRLNLQRVVPMGLPI